MIQTIELTTEEKDFYERLIGVQTLCDVTFHDTNNDLFIIQGHTISTRIKGCNAYFEDSKGKERQVNTIYFGKGKNIDFFNYLMREPFTLFNVIKEHIRNKHLFDIVTRKELQNLAMFFIKKHDVQYSKTTVDDYRRLLTACGYLFQKEPGKYIVINNRIPDTWSLKDFQTIGYESCILVTKKSKNSFGINKIDKKHLDKAWSKLYDDTQKEKYVGLCKIHGYIAVEWINIPTSKNNEQDMINASKKLTQNEKVLISYISIDKSHHFIVDAIEEKLKQKDKRFILTEGYKVTQEEDKELAKDFEPANFENMD